MTQTEALKLALEALEQHGCPWLRHEKPYNEAITAIKEVLANVPASDTSQERVDETAKNRHEQEPVAWKDKTYGNLHHQDFGNSIPLYTTPPQRTWQGLTDEEIKDCMNMSIQKTCRAVEAKLKEKNT